MRCGPERVMRVQLVLGVHDLLAAIGDVTVDVVPVVDHSVDVVPMVDHVRPALLIIPADSSLIVINYIFFFENQLS